MVQFQFQCRIDLYDWLCRCPLWFSSQTVPDLIGHESSVSSSTQTASIQSIMSLSYLVFVTFTTRSHQSQQFSIVFYVNYFYTSGHFIVLSSFCQRLHQVQSITKAQYRFQCRMHMYNRSCYCPIQFSSQIVLGQIFPNSLVLILAQKQPIQSIMLMSSLVFIIDTWSDWS